MDLVLGNETNDPNIQDSFDDLFEHFPLWPMLVKTLEG